MSRNRIARMLATIYILFISIFALDVFSEGYAGFELVTAIFMHLLPTFVLASTLAIAWKREKIGGILFLGFAVFTVFLFRTYEEMITFLLISLPLIVIGVLFYSSKRNLS